MPFPFTTATCKKIFSSVASELDLKPCIAQYTLGGIVPTTRGPSYLHT